MKNPCKHKNLLQDRGIFEYSCIDCKVELSTSMSAGFTRVCWPGGDILELYYITNTATRFGELIYINT